MNNQHRTTRDVFSREEFIRYSRQIMLPDFGEERQQRLRESSALIIGLGGLGSPAAMYLALAGIGRLGLLDSDRVELSNLHRQPLHTTDRVGRPKTESAAATLRALNPGVELQLIPERFNEKTAKELASPYDIVIDASDNFATRYLANDVCVKLGKPLVYGSVFRFEGEVSLFDVRRGPCYRCLYPEPPPADLVPDCAQAGVVGLLPGVVGLLQATEALKLLTGLGRLLCGRLLRYDALSMSFREVVFERDPTCPSCGSASRLRGGSGAETAACEHVEEISPHDLKAAMDRGDPLLLVDVREPSEHEFCRIEPSELIPLEELELRLGELPRDIQVVVYCRSGCRGGTAARLLKKHGFQKVLNLAGGILAWADEVDPTMPRY